MANYSTSNNTFCPSAEFIPSGADCWVCVTRPSYVLVVPCSKEQVASVQAHLNSIYSGPVVEVLTKKPKGLGPFLVVEASEYAGIPAE